MANDTELTISVPEAGARYFGLSRLKRVPVRAMEAKLDKLCRQGMPTVEVA